MARLRPFKLQTPALGLWTPWTGYIPLPSITLIEADTIYGVEFEHDTPYMTRVTSGRLRFHIFWRGDQDPDPHDHPWGFWTFPLTTYVEEAFLASEGDNPRKVNRVVRAFWPHYRPASYTHRVLGRGSYLWGGGVVIPGPVVTLVWREHTSRPAWGFLKCRDGRWCWQDWRAYVYGGGKHAPCEPDLQAEADRATRVNEARLGE